MPEDPFSKSDGTLWGDYKENLENDVGVNAVKGAVSDAGVCLNAVLNAVFLNKLAQY